MNNMQMSQIQHFPFWNQTISRVTLKLLFCTFGSIGVIGAGIGIGGDGCGVKGSMMSICLFHKIGGGGGFISVVGGGGVIGAGIDGGCWW